MRVKPLILSFAFSSCISLSSKAATISWESLDAGLGLQNGTDLSVGSLLRIGTFTIDNSAIRNNSGNLSFLDANFLQFDATTVGHFEDATPPTAAHWAKNSSGATDPAFANRPIYIWAFNSPTLSGANEHGIFTSNNSEWTFPSDNPSPLSRSIDLNQVQDNANQIIVGGFGVGTSDATAAPLYNLTAVPEPATTAVVAGLACFIGGVLIRRRQRSDSEATAEG